MFNSLRHLSSCVFNEISDKDKEFFSSVCPSDTATELNLSDSSATSSPPTSTSVKDDFFGKYSRLEQAVVHYNLGCTLQKRGMLREAISCYEESIKLDPSHVEPFYNLGSAFQELNDLEQAEKYYSMTLLRKPNHYLAHFNMGCLYQDNGLTEKSLEFFEKAALLNPMDSEAFINIGNSLRSLKKYQDAENAFIKAIQVDSKAVTAYFYLGNTYLETNRLDKAIQSFNEAVKQDPDYTDALFNLAVSYLDRALSLPDTKKVDLAKCLQCYETILQKAPHLDEARKGALYVRDLLVRL